MAKSTQLYLLRHADAGDPEKWRGDDAARPLSEKGRLQAERLGLFLEDAHFEPDIVVTSPKVRAADTARLVATPLGLPVHVQDALAEPLDVSAVEQLLAALGNPTRPLLVGHDPDFSAVAAELLGFDELPLKKGALVRIDTDRPLEPCGGTLRWLVPPDLFRE